jgi:hydrogenase expression/formation protein HypC
VRIVELLPGDSARVSLDGVMKTISTALLDGLAIGDYVILHVGYALAKVDEDEARRTLEMLRESGVQA